MRYEKHTGFEFLGLIIVLEHEGVKVSMASDLELGLRSVAQLVLLYPRRYSNVLAPVCTEGHSLLLVISLSTVQPNAVELADVVCKRTLCIFPAADLDELLDVGDFARHSGRL